MCSFIHNAHVSGASERGAVGAQTPETSSLQVDHMCTSFHLSCAYVRSELLEALQDKERRVQQQLDRCAEERGRKMEQQRRKEQKRRAAAEEKRRQQQEAEKVRGFGLWPARKSLKSTGRAFSVSGIIQQHMKG